MPTNETDLVVIGAGPGGYAAAFFAAASGLSVTLIDADNRLGGVCLNRGCIPSKALLHVAKLIREAATSSHHGLTFGSPTIDLDTLRSWKNAIIDKLSSGVSGLAKKRNVTVIQGNAIFQTSNQIRINTPTGQQYLAFKNAIIATGSRPALPNIFDLGSARVMTSTEALDLADIPDTLLVIGGGYIGMELGTVYSALGSRVTIVEAQDSILSGADSDLIRPVLKFAEENFESVNIKTSVKSMKTKGAKVAVNLESDGHITVCEYDKVLVSVGRLPNSKNLGLENTAVQLDEKGYIKIDNHCRTNEKSIYAIGDVAGGLMLAHKASKEARIAVENINGDPTTFNNRVVPAVVFTDPEIAWAGLTEAQAKIQNIPVIVSKFPWGASGRALTFDRTDGMTKLILEPGTDRVLGVGIVGIGAGELIAEGVLAIELGATAHDLGDVIHAHPTLSETLMEAAEAHFGFSAHMFTPPNH